MSDGTKIEWTDASWNPLRGCSRVSEGCRNCYAETVAGRFSGPGMPYEGLITKTSKGPTWNGEINLVPEKLAEPLRWTKPRMIFVNSMSDLFHENVPEKYIQKVFAVMAAAKKHTFQILTKRPEKMLKILASKDLRWIVDGCIALNKDGLIGPEIFDMEWPLPNVWLGVSVENQATADERIPLLLQTPAAVRWISAEPLIGPVDISQWIDPDYFTGCADDGIKGLHWVVAGGESGSNARPMHPDWARSLRDQCQEAGVPFLFKQHGEWLATSFCDDDMAMLPSKRTVYVGHDGIFHDGSSGVDFFGGEEETAWVGKKAAGRVLDGRTWDEYPESHHASL